MITKIIKTIFGSCNVEKKTCISFSLCNLRKTAIPTGCTMGISLWNRSSQFQFKEKKRKNTGEYLPRKQRPQREIFFLLFRSLPSQSGRLYIFKHISLLLSNSLSDCAIRITTIVFFRNGIFEETGCTLVAKKLVLVVGRNNRLSMLS